MRGYDKNGLLLLNTLISKDGGKQVVTNLPIIPASVQLISLSTSKGNITPGFNQDHSDYTLSLTFSDSVFTMIAIPVYPHAVLKLGADTLIARSPSQPIQVEVGENIFSILVSAGVGSGVYSLKAIREPKPLDIPPPDKNAIILPGSNKKHSVDTVFSAWKYHAMVAIDLKSVGVDSSTILNSFPLLLRLTSANFTFSQSDSGKDLRFALANGQILSHEICQWEAGQAVVWIKIPMLDFKQDTAKVYMYWGKANAKSISGGILVFGGAADFSGVWHLDEIGKGIGGEYRDALSQNNGTAGAGDGNNLPTRIEGVVGYAQNFKASSVQGTIDIPKTFDPGATEWSMQAWIHPEGIGPQNIFNKSDDWLASKQRFQIQLTGSQANQITISREGLIAWTDIFLALDRFTLIGIKFNGNAFDIFVDGVLQVGNGKAFTQGGSAGSAVFLGSNQLNGNSEGFGGKMDELWFLSKAQSKEWFKVSYENQKVGSTLVKILSLP